MPVTLPEVQGLIQAAFPNADVSGIEERNHYISGTILSEEFRAMDFDERLRQVRLRIRDRLGLDGMNLGVLYPLAPGESLDD